jgi:hypothetical protein
MNPRLALPMGILLLTSPFSSAANPQPLFDTEEPLSLVLELPLSDLLRRASKKPTVSGTLRYTGADGADVVLDVEVSTRGKSRLEECSFPPLSLNLKRQQVAATIFAGQNKLKLVTQCDRSKAYLRYLNQEYVIYRMYNVLTDYSFRVRMLEMTYRDSGRSGKDKVQPAFFIESDKAAADRLGMASINTGRVKLSQLEPVELSKFTLFQFMIGNTDWSVRSGPEGEGCCHNGKVIAPPDSNTGWVVLPYDFDQAGLINTRYSAPSDQLRIKSVRQRLYRGFCKSNALLKSTIAMFNDKRSAIEAVTASGPNGPYSNESVLKYLQGFFEIINDPNKRQKKIIDDCQGKKT